MKNVPMVLKAMFVGGLIMMLAGLIMIIGYGTLETVGPIYTILGLIVMGLGGFWTYKVNQAIKKYSKNPKKYKKFSKYSIALFLILSFGLTLSGTVLAEIPTPSPECLMIYRRVQWVEYTMLGMLIFAGFLSFGPIILGRTILGPILQELQYIAGAMLVLLIFALLVVFPLDPMFVLDNPRDPTGCYISIKRLKDHGPPLLQIILKLFIPSEEMPVPGA